jgi:hypothetical protein
MLGFEEETTIISECCCGGTVARVATSTATIITVVSVKASH